MSITDWPQPSSDWLRRASQGDNAASSHILDMYREQLKRVVSARLDPRLAARLDPSDVVHDVMAIACNSLPDWIEEDKVVYACLHRLVRDRLSTLRRDHITYQKRSVNRETANFAELSDESVMHLCERLGVESDTPSQIAIRNENKALIRAALIQLRDSDREILVMRILEGTPAKEVAEILGISESAVHMRQMRALETMQSLLGKLR